MAHARARLLAASMLLSTSTVTAACRSESGDDADTSSEWAFAPQKGAIMAGAMVTIQVDAPKVCSAGTCELSTMNEVSSDAPEVAIIEGFREGQVDVRGVAQGVATISFEATTPDGDAIAGAFLVLVADVGDGTLSFLTACGEDTDIGAVALAPGEVLGVSAHFTMPSGQAVIGEDVAVPLVLDPPDAGEISGTVTDGVASSVDLALANDTTAPEVAVALKTGKELARLTLATTATIDGWRIEPPVHDPTLGEYHVDAALTVGSRKICFDPHDPPLTVRYLVTFETPDVCDAGFGDTSVQPTSSFTVVPKLAGDCVVRLRWGSLEELLTIPVTL